MCMENHTEHPAIPTMPHAALDGAPSNYKLVYKTHDPEIYHKNPSYLRFETLANYGASHSLSTTWLRVITHLLFSTGMHP